MLLANAACSAGRFRYPERDKERYESRDLEQLIADGTGSLAAGVTVEQLSQPWVDQRDEYRLGRNDVLDISVLGHPEIGTRESAPGTRIGTTVRKDGHVWLPVVGPVLAEGRTVTEFEGALREAVARYYVDAQVSVEILEHESQKFFVLGELRVPGAFPVDGDTTLLEAVGLAGGVAETGDPNGITVVRDGQPLPIDVGELMRGKDLAKNIYMQHGDVVFVPSNADQKVFVLGEVMTPGVVPIARSRLTLAEALASTGGPAPAKARRELAVIRGGFAKPIVYHLDLDKALLFDDAILLRPGDRVVVAPTGMATASRYMTQLLPFLMGAQAAGFAAQGGVNVRNAINQAAATGAGN